MFHWFFEIKRHGQPLTFAPESEKYQLSPKDMAVIDEGYANLKKLLEEED